MNRLNIMSLIPCQEKGSENEVPTVHYFMLRVTNFF